MHTCIQNVQLDHFPHFNRSDIAPRILKLDPLITRSEIRRRGLCPNPEKNPQTRPAAPDAPARLATYISTADKHVSKAKRAMLAARASAPSACCRSLHGPCHCSIGTGLSSGIMPAPPAAAPSTPTPDHHAAQLARAARTRSLGRGCSAYHSGHSPCWFARWWHSVVCTECHHGSSQCTASAGRSQTKASGAPRKSLGTTAARQPHCIVQAEPDGRAGDEPDGGRVGHDGLARWRAGVATDRPLGTRGVCVFVSCPRRK